jgi:gliding motility-associated-like protein
LVSNELSFEANEGGTYLCRMTNMENGCASEASIELVEDFTPATAVITAENGGVLTCDFPSIVLSGVQSTPAGALGYLWQSPSGLPAGSQSEVVASVGGAYQLIVEHLSSGCRDTAETQVSVDQEIPVVTVALPGILTCAQTELPLDAAGSSAGVEFVYAWTAQPGLILEGATGAEPIIGQAGTYQLRITDSSNGCADSVIVTVTADTVPPVAAATALDELNCVTDAVTLTASGSSTGSDISLLWTTLSGGILSGDPSSEEVEALSAGLYLLQVERTSNGCTASDTVVVTENTAVPSSIATELEPPYCPGGRGRLTITSVLGGTPPYLYSLNSQAFSPQVAYDNLAPGMYTVVVQDVIGCEDSVTVTIDEPAGPQIFLPNAINMRFSETRQLLPDLNFPESLIDSLIWSPGDFLSCTDCLRPFVELPRHTITYRLTIVTTEGCSADGEILVRVNRLRSVYVPNAFSPGNQDGFNDELTVYGPVDEVRRINRFAIFDRWGEQVFEARDFAPNDPTAGWNGLHQGQMMDPGVFVYLAEVEFVDGEVVIYEGDVTLIR